MLELPLTLHQKLKRVHAMFGLTGLECPATEFDGRGADLTA